MSQGQKGSYQTYGVKILFWIFSEKTLPECPVHTEKLSPENCQAGQEGQIEATHLSFSVSLMFKESVRHHSAGSRVGSQLINPSDTPGGRLVANAISSLQTENWGTERLRDDNNTTTKWQRERKKKNSWSLDAWVCFFWNRLPCLLGRLIGMMASSTMVG